MTNTEFKERLIEALEGINEGLAQLNESVEVLLDIETDEDEEIAESE